MKRPPILIAFLLGLILAIAPLGWTALRANAAPPAITTLQQVVKAWAEAALSRHAGASPIAGADSEDPPTAPDAKEFEHLVKGWERLEGLFTLYRDRPTGKLYLEIRPDQLNVNYLSTVTLESGVGEGWLYSGLPLLDLLFNFRQVNNRVQFVVPNLYFRTRPGDPQTAAVRRAFSDSTLQSAAHSQHPSHPQKSVNRSWPPTAQGLSRLNPHVGAHPGSTLQPGCRQIQLRHGQGVSAQH